MIVRSCTKVFPRYRERAGTIDVLKFQNVRMNEIPNPTGRLVAQLPFVVAFLDARGLEKPSLSRQGL
jgi:hypothetical protein